MVTEDDVKKVAENARISLEEEEVSDFTEEFEEILEVFSKLEEIDTDEVEPAFHPVDVEPESREDSEGETLDVEEVFANTDNEEDGKFQGPPV